MKFTKAQVIYVPCLRKIESPLNVWRNMKHEVAKISVCVFLERIKMTQNEILMLQKKTNINFAFFEMCSDKILSCHFDVKWKLDWSMNGGRDGVCD